MLIKMPFQVWQFRNDGQQSRFGRGETGQAGLDGVEWHGAPGWSGSRFGREQSAAVFPWSGEGLFLRLVAVSWE